MNLIDFLRLADPHNLALVTERWRLTFGELITQAEEFRAALDGVPGLRLFLNISDPANAAVTFTALDGVAGALVFSSPALGAALVTTLAVRADSDAILSDRDDVEGRLPVVRSTADLAAISVSRSFGGVSDWVMTTSGTTGQPKLVAHTLDSLTRTTKRDQARGRGQIWGLLYDYTRFAGLQVVLQSLLSGATLVVPSLTLPLEARIDLLVEAGVTHLSATPTLWRKILMTPGAERLMLRQVTLGGEIADDAILSALSRRYPNARISHIFASTEAGVGFSVTDRRSGFPTDFLAHPPLGIGLRIEDDHLFIRNDRVAPNYLGDEGEVARDGWVNTGDEVSVEGDRVLFLGRSSGVINVGGDKVHPEEVEAAILAHPAVAMVRVYAKKNPIVGALVASDIVPKAIGVDRGALREDLKGWLADRLERHKVPAFMRIVDEFETNAAGKLKRTD